MKSNSVAKKGSRNIAIGGGVHTRCTRGKGQCSIN